MNLTLRLFFIVYITFFLISCSTYETSTVKTTDIYGTGVLHKPVAAELSVNENKVTGEASAKRGVSSLEDVKQYALEDAVNKSNADVLVEPKFTTTMTRRKINVVVTGYPATYTNFRTADINDTELLKLSVIQKPNISEPSEWKEKEMNKKKDKNRGSGGGLVSLLVVGGLIYWLATEDGN